MKMHHVRHALVASLLAAPLLAHGQAPTPSPAAPAASTPAPAPAPVSAEQRAAIKDLLDAMKTRDGLTKALGAVTQSLPQRMYEAVIRQLELNQALTPEQKQRVVQNIGPSFDAAIKESQATVSDPKVIDEAMDKAVGIYASHFTLQEVKELTAFYRTPTGAKSINAVSQANGEAFQAATQIFSPRVSGIMEKMMKTQVDAVTSGAPAPAPSKAPAKAPAKK
jgi:uncharacterized protein